MCDYQWVPYCYIWGTWCLIYLIVQTLWYTIKIRQFILRETILLLLPLALLLSQEIAAQIPHLLFLSSNLVLPEMESSKVHLLYCDMLWLQRNEKLGIICLVLLWSMVSHLQTLLWLPTIPNSVPINIIRKCGGSWDPHYLYVTFMGSWAWLRWLCCGHLIRDIYLGEERALMTNDAMKAPGSRIWVDLNCVLTEPLVFLIGNFLNKHIRCFNSALVYV